MSDSEFVKDTSLEVIVAEVSDLNLEAALQPDDDGDLSRLISSISQRTLLFFGIVPIPWILCLRNIKLRPTR